MAALRKALLPGGRSSRSEWFWGQIIVWSVFAAAYVPLAEMDGRTLTLLLAAVTVWCSLVLSIQRYHDIGYSGWRLLVSLVPVVGPLFTMAELLLRKGVEGVNRFGVESGTVEPVYKEVTVSEKNPNGLNDVTGLNPVVVQRVVRVESEEQLREVLTTQNGPFSIGGGRFSMGGQTAIAGSVHLDMRSYAGIVNISPTGRTIRVKAGTRWCDIQKAIAPFGLAVKIMQTYANFTVGGSVSVNSHGRYVGQGPLILSIRSLRVMLPDGSVTETSRTQRPELFYAVVGCYGAVAVILEVELDLATNTRIKQHSKRLKPSQYLAHLRSEVLASGTAVFHNADVYPRAFNSMRAVTWRTTQEPLTEKVGLMRLKHVYPVRQYFVWMFTTTAFGAWRRQHLYEPLFYLKNHVRWRNVEAGYDVAELEPRSREKATYVLQEYFVPIDAFEAFLSRMRTILQNAGVQTLNISIRHAYADDGSLLAWTRGETLAFVLYYRQNTDDKAKGEVAIWTRELVEAVIDNGGTYYLPYQPHATLEQFHRAHPGAQRLFSMKQQLDPDYKLRNSLWTMYYRPETTAP